MKDEGNVQACNVATMGLNVLIHYLKRQPSDVKNIKYSYSNFYVTFVEFMSARNSGMLWTERI
jgi:hypothetical protein